MPSTPPLGQRAVEPVDSDFDLRVMSHRRELGAHRWVLPVIALGGMIGSSARYAMELAWSAPAGAIPLATLTTNVSGCLLIGVLMVHVLEVSGAHPLVRPFLGVGVIGGFTTFSTYTVQSSLLLTHGNPALSMIYLFGTLLTAMTAVVAGVFLARGALRARRWLAHHRKGSR